MNTMAKFKIPGSFVVDRVDLTTREVAYGKHWGWLDDSATAQIYAHKMRTGRPLLESEERWALALSGESGSGDLPDLSPGDLGDDRELSAVWIYLSLAWLHPHLHRRGNRRWNRRRGNLCRDSRIRVCRDRRRDHRRNRQRSRANSTRVGTASTRDTPQDLRLDGIGCCRWRARRVSRPAGILWPGCCGSSVALWPQG